MVKAEQETITKNFVEIRFDISGLEKKMNDSFLRAHTKLLANFLSKIEFCRKLNVNFLRQKRKEVTEK